MSDTLPIKDDLGWTLFPLRVNTLGNELRRSMPV